MVHSFYGEDIWRLAKRILSLKHSKTNLLNAYLCAKKLCGLGGDDLHRARDGYRNHDYAVCRLEYVCSIMLYYASLDAKIDISSHLAGTLLWDKEKGGLHRKLLY